MYMYHVTIQTIQLPNSLGEQKLARNHDECPKTMANNDPNIALIGFRFMEQ